MPCVLPSPRTAPARLPATAVVLLTLLVGSFAWGAAANGDDIDTGYRKEIRPLLETHCFKCHNDKKQKGGIDLTRFTSEEAILKEYKLWRRVIEQVTAQEMPPDDETGFTQMHGTVVINGVKRTLAQLEDDHPVTHDPGPALIRRLSRNEYNNVIRDLTGLDFDAAAAVGFTQDTTGSSFENVAAALNLSPSLLEKYFTAADLVLEKLFGDPNLTPEARKEAEKSLDGKAKVVRAAFRGDLPAQPDHASAEKFLASFARRAWRRPIAPDETARLLKFFDTAIARNAEPNEALRQSLKPILVAPDFLFRIEEDRTPKDLPEGAKSAAKISDIELASRLSFFLWSSIPDELLLAAAEQGKLSDPAELASQVTRLLADPKGKALADAMLLRWLGANKVMEARPTTEFFPAFNQELKRSMREEARSFCDNLRTENRPVLDLLESDYTFVNADLAKHYGLPEVKGKDMQRVTLKPEDHRGGVLGMGAVLATTSHTFRTSPTQRGRWVLDVIFGTPPPPPPANAGLFKDEKKEKEPKDFREKLAQHAADPNCAGCHRRMDPLGFGLDNYNAVGQWRPTSPDLNTHGELPTGERFDGVAELKQVIWKRRDEFVRNLIGETLAFALGREVDYFDEGQISRIKLGMEKDDLRFSSLILGVVNSYPFQYRRNAESKTAQATAQP
jgi:mono/diheme cytochrome c family protein